MSKKEGHTENQATGSDLDTLKAQAKSLGITFHPAIGIAKLQAMINSHEPEATASTPEILTVSEITELQQLRAEKAEREAAAAAKPILTEQEKIDKMIKEQSKLVRVVVNCMNPNKRDWEGEMYTVGNRYVKFKKFVPFNNEEGWHIPTMMYNHLKDRQCQVFYTRKDNRGNKTRHGKLINELSVQVLPPLTIDELHALAQRQAMANGSAEA